MNYENMPEELKNKGLIRSQTVFKLYTRIKSNTSFYVGSFSLKPSMSMTKIIDKQLNHPTVQRLVKK